MNHAQIYRPYDPIVSNCFLPECHIKLIILEPRGKRAHLLGWLSPSDLSRLSSRTSRQSSELSLAFATRSMAFSVSWNTKKVPNETADGKGDPASLNADALVDDGSLKPKCSARSLKPGLTWPRPKESSLRLLQPAKGTLNLVRALPRLTCQAIHLASLSQIGAGRFVVKMDINGSLSNAHGPQWHWLFW